jgi:hypothetical protein
VVNSVVGGATVALVCALAIKAASPIPVLAGIVAGLVMLAAGLRYEDRRLTQVVLNYASNPVESAEDRVA